MRPAPAHQPCAFAEKSCRQRCLSELRREERIAQRGQRSGNAHNQHSTNASEGANWRDQLDAAAQVTRAAAQHVRRERQRGQQQQRIGKVQRQVRRRAAATGSAPSVRA